ncbi:putative ribonuclease H protein, partial [Trifolium medium]|nr:putative ribonuclease H protein [Trifolium medium]
MMSSKIPKSCLDDIQMLQRSFVWGDTEQKKRFHAVGWEKITVPKWLGGLGIRKLDVMNNACLMKLGWNYQGGSDDLWCKVLRGKYEDSRLQRQQEAWLEEGLCIDQHVVIPNQLQGLKVCDLVDIDGKWNCPLFEDWLPIHLKHKVAAILPPDKDNGSDERIGVGGKKCNFSISN